MKERYRVIQRSDRGGGCYCVDNQTGERTSLGTKDRKEALVRSKISCGLPVVEIQQSTQPFTLDDLSA